MKSSVLERKKVVGNYKIETPGNIWFHGIVCLRSKMYAYKCGKKAKKKVNAICKSQSTIRKVEDYKKMFG